ncbi:receptor-like protein EIX2 [Dioscorea cayenensis subsp. rotundata]|uniref:Receptor-like protein EIX2 n=1 Tax=Dioscorea cayennensis subsp. rotundata TaxID=55577 RepID=A0AB40B1A3_DIOCR|nr:receptor-like protein EIX2 [Dioscorea cayenensis subsp. rotundata]
MPVFLYLLPLLLLLLVFGLAVICSDAAALVPNVEHPTNCIESERVALFYFKKNIIDPYNNLSSWVGHACCSWHGVQCDNTTGNIVGLALGQQGSVIFHLQGGEISPTLLALQHLNYLDLSGNDFRGTNVPSFISHFKQLKYLNLARAGFGGPVPSSFGNLSSLQTLDLSDNYGVYVDDPSHQWLSHLTSLQHLVFSGVTFSSHSSNSLFLALNKLPSINEIRLSGCQLQSIPPSIPHLNFSSLLFLDLSFNSINFPVFDLSYNSTNFPVPPWLFNLKSLEYLDLSNNIFGSSISADYLSSNFSTVLPKGIGNLCNLKTLDLSNSNMGMRLAELNFTGCIKDSLTHLHLSDANLDGDIPDWMGDIKDLKVLDLSENSLSGSLTSSIVRLSLLETLNLFSNKLNGTLPVEIGKLTELESLDLGENQMRGAITEAHFSNLQKLNVLRMQSNSFVFNVSSNWIPPFLLQELRIRSCSVGSEFPTWLQTQHKLNVLDISNTGISSTVPDWFWNLVSVNLAEMYMSENQIEGMLPKFSTSMQLNTIDLSSNRFYGPLPGFLGSSISYINFSNNSFSGAIPDSISYLPQLAQLRLSHNKLSGEIPAILKNCSQLEVLDLGYNNFTGSIPIWVGKSLSRLVVLILRANTFSDHIPQELSQLKYLQILDLSRNNFSGPIPVSFGNLSAMQSLFNSDLLWYGILGVQDTIMVASNGKEKEYSQRLLPYVKIMDLSNNVLTGGIPQELASLYGLQSLHLAGNQLEGEIPDKLGQLQQLESLDLSRNKLSGSIPSTFSNLTSLSDFNVSYNDLSGKIPSGNQFNTFTDPSIYTGNHLCGFPLTDNCTKGGGPIPTEPSDHGNEEDDDKEMVWMYIGSLSGFAVGFWTIWGVLIFKKKWRYAYFRYTDTSCDNIHVWVVVNFARMKSKIMSKSNH